MLGHVLIGLPGSGKSTFARFLADCLPNSTIVSTDAIRARLYGDESIQGEWAEIEREMLQDIHNALAAAKTVIYDATNFKRSDRLTWLRHPETAPIEWLGWHLQTPLTICKQWNSKRDRVVPDEILESMNRTLKQFPPIAAEGFAAVYTYTPHTTPLTAQTLLDKIASLPRSQINSRNRTRRYTFHQYSSLLDFERLMYLISSLLRYPGLGNLQQLNPSLLAELLGEGTHFETAVDEVSAVMSRKWGKIYSDRAALSQDIHWLTLNGLIGGAAERPELAFPDILPSPHPPIPPSPHAYSDREPFERLMKTIRFILRHPFERDSREGTQKALIASMQARGLIPYDCLDSIQKDIEKVLKPYQILAAIPYKQGYFAGTAILTAEELQRIYQLLQARILHSHDRATVELYQSLGDRLRWGNWLEPERAYPVRAVGVQSIVSIEHLPASSLAKQPERVEAAILAGECLELNRLPGGGRYAGDGETFFRAYPLQLLFHNIAWYLGYEEVGGLLRFERLDRLFLGRQCAGESGRSRAARERALQKLTQLYNASAGLFLGNSIEVQQQFLRGEAAARVTVELWAGDAMFRFIAEGTQRFGRVPLQMSPPPNKSRQSLDARVFVLEPTGDEQFPHRLRLSLPIWSLQDVDFRRWILGFVDGVKVVQPLALAATVGEMGRAIAAIYR